MATTSLNIVQRLGGPTLTAICTAFLAWRLERVHTGTHSEAAFTETFILLCGLQALLFVAALRLPASIEEADQAIAEGRSAMYDYDHLP